MKKISFLQLIEITLAVIAVVLFAAFFMIVSKHNARQNKAAGELQAAIQNAVEVCNSYADKINIAENLRDDLDIYISDINSETSLERKAYYAKIMLTYTQNRVNMNDPQTLYELAKELGTAYSTTTAEINAYKDYINEISEAFSRFTAAEKAYNTISAEKYKTANNASDPEMIPEQ